MPSLSTLSGREVVKAFAKNGWQMVRQRGSHMILVKDGHMATLSVPDCREVAKGTLRSLIRSSGRTVEEFVALLGKLSALAFFLLSCSMIGAAKKIRHLTDGVAVGSKEFRPNRRNWFTPSLEDAKGEYRARERACYTPGSSAGAAPLTSGSGPNRFGPGVPGWM